MVNIINAFWAFIAFIVNIVIVYVTYAVVNPLIAALWSSNTVVFIISNFGLYAFIFIMIFFIPISIATDEESAFRKVYFAR